MKALPNAEDLSGSFDLPGEERYIAFLARVIQQVEVWTLKGHDGFIAFSDDDGRDCFPFWPDAACAKALATEDWGDCRPEPLALDVFMTRWLPGMAKDGRLAAVFPAPDGSGVVIEPETLLQDLREEIDDEGQASNP
jgi:hypothetical protein